MEYRKCKVCGEVKPLNYNFYSRTGKSGEHFRWVCRICANEQNKARSKGFIYPGPKPVEEIKRVQFILKTQKSKYPSTSYASMTKDKIYDVINENNDCYIVKDDSGKIVELNKTRFKKVK